MKYLGPCSCFGLFRHLKKNKRLPKSWAVVVPQLVERVASDTRDPRFESQHWQNFIYQFYIEIENTKIKKERPSMAHL